MSFPPPSVPQESLGAPPKIKPGTVWYWLGAALVVVGVIGGVILAVAGFVNLKNTIDDFGRFKVSNGQGAATVTFDKPDTYSIYYESRSKVCADLTQSSGQCTKDTVRAPKSPPARLDITVAKNGEPLEVKSASNSFDYSLGGYTGKKVASVKVDEPGAYSMVVQTRREGDFTLALGNDVVSAVVPWIIGALAVALVGVIAGVLILVLTGVKRGRRKREWAMTAATEYPATPPLVATPVLAGAPSAPAITVPVQGERATDHSVYAPPAGWTAPPVAPPPVAAAPPASAPPPVAAVPPVAVPPPVAAPVGAVPPVAVPPPVGAAPPPPAGAPVPGPPPATETVVPPPPPAPTTDAPAVPTAAGLAPPPPPPPGSPPAAPTAPAPVSPPFAPPSGSTAGESAIPPPPPPKRPDEEARGPADGRSLPPPPPPPPGN